MKSLLATFVLLSAAFAALTSLARAQNVNGFYAGYAWTTSYVAGQYLLSPLANATVTVCAYPAVSLPCTNLATLYADPTTATPAPATFAADSQGNFSFWAPPGYYAYTLTSALNVTTGPYAVVVSSGSAGGGGGALFPSTAGIVYNTSTTASTSATSGQIVAALDLSPSATLSPALLPLATSSSPGAVQPDNSTITISGGVISATGGGGGGSTIPATTVVLKGSGTAQIALGAIPGTDYVVPSGTVANLSGTPLLPNGTTAATQTTGDNSAKLATDQFVLANTLTLSAIPATSSVLKGSGTLGSSLPATAGTDYVIPSGTVANLSGTPALPNGTTATTQTTGDSSTRLATDAFVLANVSGIGTTTNALTLNNSGSGAAPGTTFNGSAAVALSYNTLGAQQALTLTTLGSSGAATLSAGTLNIPQYSGGSGMVYPGAGIANSTGSAWGTSYTATGTGAVLALATSPTLVTPALGTPSAAVLTNATGLPLTTGVTGILPIANGGTGAATVGAHTAFGNFTGSTAASSFTATTGTGSPVAATSPTLVTPALGVATGTSLALGGGTALTTTNQTGTGSIVLATGGAINPASTGATTPGTGAFTTLAVAGSGSGSVALSGSSSGTPVVANTWGIMGPAETTYTAWAEQPANATSGGPSANQVKVYGASVSGVSQFTFGPAIVRGTGTYTTATSDAITVTGAGPSSICAFSPTNATAAAATVIGYISAVTTNSVTISHVATTASGGTVNVICTTN